MIQGYMKAPGGGLILNKEIVNITPTFDVAKGDILYSKSGQFSKLYLDWYDFQYVVIKSALANNATTAYKVSYLDASIQLLFHLDGNLKDSSKNGLLQSLIVGTSFITGKFGQGIKAVSANDYIKYDTSGSLNLASLTNFTIDWWEYHPNNDPTYGTIMQCVDSSSVESRYIFGQYYSGSYNFVIGNAAINLGMFDVGAWTNYRVTKSSNIYKTWKNGVFVAQSTINMATSGANLFFLNTTGLTYANTGLVLDEVLISNTVMNTENFTPKAAPYTLYS